MQTLLPLAEAGTPIVFCEPSCYSAVRDDHPHLLRNDLKRQAELVAAACVTFEEWAADMLDCEEVDVRLRQRPGEILLHGHCHQKSLVGMGSSVRLLSAIPGCTVTDLDSGCCGMAGSFGYEREHYEISEAIGQRTLFPAVREMSGDTAVVAPGFSCRHQIKHFTGVDTHSTATLLESLLIAD